jgi:hypothetical protein
MLVFCAVTLYNSAGTLALMADRYLLLHASCFEHYLVHAAQGGDIHSLTPHHTSRANAGGILTGAAADWNKQQVEEEDEAGLGDERGQRESVIN